MKNKGFTLIELLAVIVILAIVALITVPTVLGVIEKTKKSALKDSAYGLIESANLYYAQYGVSKIARFDIENGVQNTEEENELSYKGNIKNGTVLINNKGKIMVCVNEDGYSAYKNYSQNEVIAVNKETCYIPENNSMVYLEQSGKTLSELTNQELTEEIENLKNEIALIKENKTDTTTTSSLQGELTSLSSVLGNHTNTIDNINNKIGNTDISSIGSDITSSISNLNNLKQNKIEATTNTKCGEWNVKIKNQVVQIYGNIVHVYVSFYNTSSLPADTSLFSLPYAPIGMYEVSVPSIRKVSSTSTISAVYSSYYDLIYPKQTLEATTENDPYIFEWTYIKA